MIKFLATKHSVTYVDANEVFKTKDLQELYIDAVHLNAKGQEELKNIYTKIIE
jgi:lysophospholipase L1-like esterase